MDKARHFSCNIKLLLLSIFAVSMIFGFSAAGFAAARISEDATVPPGRIADDPSGASQPAPEASATAETYFQNPDVAFVVETGNGDHVAASSKNIADPRVLAGVKAAYSRLNENPDFVKMVEFYKRSVEKRKDVDRKKISDKIVELQSELKKGNISKRMAKSQTEYFQQELKKISEIKAPPLTIVVGQDASKPTSYMMPAELKFTDKAGARVSTPCHIVLQMDEFLAMADDSKKIDGFVVLAHEAGHVISDNTTGIASVGGDYKDPDPLFLVDDAIKSDQKVRDFISKGDPMPASHWRNKVIHSNSAFEEGFAEFTAALFSQSESETASIKGSDFAAEKMGYRLSVQTDEVKATLEWTNITKKPEQVLNTEYFIAKMLYRVAGSFDSLDQGFSEIMDIKSTKAFKDSPNLLTFLVSYARRSPDNYLKFKKSFDEEVAKINVAAKATYYQGDDAPAALLAEVKNSVFAIGDSALFDAGVSFAPGGGSSSSEVSITVTKNKPVKIFGAPGSGVKLNEATGKIKNTRISDR